MLAKKQFEQKSTTEHKESMKFSLFTIKCSETKLSAL